MSKANPKISYMCLSINRITTFGSKIRDISKKDEYIFCNYFYKFRKLKSLVFYFTYLISNQ